MKGNALYAADIDGNLDVVGFLELVKDPDTILSEDILISLNKGLLKEVLRSRQNLVFGYNASSHQQVWNALISTAGCLDVANKHLTTACNAICGFLNVASSSATEELLGLGCAETTWTAAFNIYLSRYQDTKPKVMSQLLSTLVEILSKNQDSSISGSIRTSSAKIILNLIRSLRSAALIKPSLVALQVFLRKNVYSIDKILEQESQNEVPSPVEDFVWYSKQLVSDTHVEWRQNPTFDIAITSSFKRLFAAVLFNCFHTETILVAAKLLATILDLSETCDSKLGDSDSLCQCWVEMLGAALCTQPEALQEFKTYVFPTLFKDRPLRFVAFLEASFPSSTGSGKPNLLEELGLKHVLFTLEVGRELGMVREIADMAMTGTTSSAITVENDEVSLKAEFLYRYLYQMSPTIRLAAFSLIITSSQTTAPMKSMNLAMLKKYLFYTHADPDPEVRSKILSLERRLILRLRGAVSALKKDHSFSSNDADPEDSNDPKVLLEAHESFLNWYIATLINDLGPSATYQKHVCALKSMQMLLQTGLDKNMSSMYLSKVGQDQVSWVIHLPVFGKCLFRNLFDLISNPFEDIRSGALAILKMSPISNIGAQDSPSILRIDDVRNATSQAEVLAGQTGRADHADAVARFHDLAFHLTVGLSVETTYITLIRRHPFDVVASILTRLDQESKWTDSNSSSRAYYVHGFLSALRYIMSYSNFHQVVRALGSSKNSNWRHIHDSCIGIFSSVWNDVQGILCIDSPEGQGDEEGDYDLGAGPKDRLSASWRALREASLLLDAMLSNPTYAPSEGAFQLTHKDFEFIGTLCFTQLAELRHRGAFSTVSQTFSTCCGRCEISTNPSIHQLPTGWLEDALVIIDEKATKLTRRSAGIPAIISGIISANPGGPLFHRAMSRLTKVAEHPPPETGVEIDVRLPQVHALNCLKDIVTNTKLGASTEAFIPSLVEISVRCIESQRWAIRNCGLMLLRALISRMCQSSHLSSSTGNTEDSPNHLAKILFDKFPQLGSIILNLLETDDENLAGDPPLSSRSPQVELATQKIFVALELIRRRSSSVDIETRLLELIFRYISHRNWSIREQAAKAYSSQISQCDRVRVANALLSHQWHSTNALHGALLTVRYLVQNMISTSSMPGIPRPPAKYRKQDPNPVTDKFISILQTADIHRQGILDRNCRYTAEVFWAIACDLLGYLIKISYQYEFGPTVCRENAFGTEYERQCDFDGDTVESLFLGFSKPRSNMPPSHAGDSYLRFLSLWFILEVSEGTMDGPPESLGYDTLNGAIDVTDIDASKVLSGLEDTFPHPDWMSHNRQALYGLFLSEKRNEETKVEALKNIAEVYLRFSMGRKNQRSILLDTSTMEYHVRELTDPHSQFKRYETRDMADAKLWLEGTAQAIHWGRFETIDNVEQTIKEFLGDTTLPWIRHLRLAGDDRNEFSTRLSAIRSIEAFQYNIRPRGESPRNPELFLDLYLTLYDLLNDDDEDIRNLGARVASWILGGSEADIDAFHNKKISMALLPLSASYRLSQFFGDRYSISEALFCETVGRVTGHGEILNRHSSPVSFRPVRALLDEYLRGNTDLFAEERRNLFIDDAREIVVWSEVAANLSVKSFNHSVLQDLIKWTMDGLMTLALTAGIKQVDGPLGWTSDPEVFVLGLRVLYASQVLCYWSKQNGAEIDSTTIYDNLTILVERGEEVQLHERWLETARTILRASEEPSE